MIHSSKPVCFSLGCALLLSTFLPTAAYSQVSSLLNSLGSLIRAPVKLPQLENLEIATGRILGEKYVPVEVSNPAVDDDEQSVNVHFVPQWNDTEKGLSFVIQLPDEEPDVEIIDTVDLDVYARDEQRIILQQNQTSAIGTVKSRSGRNQRLDFIVPISPDLSPLVVTIAFILPRLKQGKVVLVELNVSIYQNSMLDDYLQSIKNKLPAFSKEELIEYYQYLIERLIDELEGNFVEVLSPEQYRNRAHLLGEGNTGLTSSVCSFEHHPCQPFTASQTVSHWRSAMLMVGGGGGRIGHQPGRRLSGNRHRPAQRPGNQPGEDRGGKGGASQDTGSQTNGVLVYAQSPSSVYADGRPVAVVHPMNRPVDRTLQPSASNRPYIPTLNSARHRIVPIRPRIIPDFPRISEDSIIDPLIVALINRCVDTINAQPETLPEEDPTGRFRLFRADEADIFLYHMTLIAIDMYLQGLDDGVQSVERDQLTEYLSTHDPHGYFENPKRLEEEKRRFLNQEKARKFYLPKRVTGPMSEVINSLPGSVRFLVEQLKAQDWGSPERIEQWRMTVYSYALRILFYHRNHYISANQRAVLVNMIDEAFHVQPLNIEQQLSSIQFPVEDDLQDPQASSSENYPPWRFSMITAYPQDTYYEDDISIIFRRPPEDESSNDEEDVPLPSPLSLSQGFEGISLNSNPGDFYSLVSGMSRRPSLSNGQHVMSRTARRFSVERSPGPLSSSPAPFTHIPYPFSSSETGYPITGSWPEPYVDQPQTDPVRYHGHREIFSRRNSPYPVPHSPARSRRNSHSNRPSSTEIMSSSEFSMPPRDIRQEQEGSDLSMDQSGSFMQLSELTQWMPPAAIESETDDTQQSEAVVNPQNPPAGGMQLSGDRVSWLVITNSRSEGPFSSSSDGSMYSVPQTPAGSGSGAGVQASGLMNGREHSIYPWVTYAEQALPTDYTSQFMSQAGFSTQQLFDEALSQAQSVTGSADQLYQAALSNFLRIYPQHTGLNDSSQIRIIFNQYFGAYLARQRQSYWPTPR